MMVEVGLYVGVVGAFEVTPDGEVPIGEVTRPRDGQAKRKRDRDALDRQPGHADGRNR